MKFLKKYSIKLTPTQLVGVFLWACVPIIHNLHHILPIAWLATPVQYHQNLYYFLWIFEHSFAPVVGYFGTFLVIQNKLRYFALLPFGYQLYKSVEKIPFREAFNVHEEFVFIGLLFMGCIAFTIYLQYQEKKEALNRDEQKQAEKNLENIKKELNL